MAHDNLTITAVDVRLAEAVQLIARLSAELSERYQEDDGTGNFRPEDVLQPRSGFLLARWQGQAVGCGAYRPLKEDIAEIKRMYVEPAFRGHGIGRRLLAALEEGARQAGYGRVWLETGTAQPEALGLYKVSGYFVIPNYGYYRDDPRSVCFEKTLAVIPPAPNTPSAPSGTLPPRTSAPGPP
jgi:putative acetyltransferase